MAYNEAILKLRNEVEVAVHFETVISKSKVILGIIIKINKNASGDFGKYKNTSQTLA